MLWGPPERPPVGGSEIGVVPRGEFVELGSITQKSGKIVHAWAFEGNLDIKSVKSNTFTMEWPPHSGKQQEFPEVDKAEFFTIEEAKQKINPAQIELLEKLVLLYNKRRI